MRKFGKIYYKITILFLNLLNQIFGIMYFLFYYELNKKYYYKSKILND